MHNKNHMYTLISLLSLILFVFTGCQVDNPVQVAGVDDPVSATTSESSPLVYGTVTAYGTATDYSLYDAGKKAEANAIANWEAKTGTSWADANFQHTAAAGGVLLQDRNGTMVFQETFMASARPFILDPPGSLSLTSLVKNSVYVSARIDWSKSLKATGYNIYLNGVFVKQTSDLYAYVSVQPGTNCTLSVSAYYAHGESAKRTITFKTPPIVPCDTNYYSKGYLDGINSFKTGKQYYDNPYNCSSYYNGYWDGFNSQIPHY